MGKQFDSKYVVAEAAEFFKRYIHKDNDWIFNFSMEFGIFLILRNLIDIKKGERQRTLLMVMERINEMVEKYETENEKG